MLCCFLIVMLISRVIGGAKIGHHPQGHKINLKQDINFLLDADTILALRSKGKILLLDGNYYGAKQYYEALAYVFQQNRVNLNSNFSLPLLSSKILLTLAECHIRCGEDENAVFWCSVLIKNILGNITQLEPDIARKSLISALERRSRALATLGYSIYFSKHSEIIDFYTNFTGSLQDASNISNSSSELETEMNNMFVLSRVKPDAQVSEKLVRKLLFRIPNNSRKLVKPNTLNFPVVRSRSSPLLPPNPIDSDAKHEALKLLLTVIDTAKYVFKSYRTLWAKIARNIQLINVLLAIAISTAFALNKL